MQLFFWNWNAVGVFVLSIAMILWFKPWWMLWLSMPLKASLIHHNGINYGHVMRNRSRSREDHHLLWCNFCSETERPLVFWLYLSAGLSHGEFIGFVCFWRFVWYTIMGYMPGTSREIDIAAERIITCCDATFFLKPNRHWCFHCIYRQETLIQAMVNSLAISASDGSFATPYWDICQAHHKKSI
jgi:hypothetical protein